MKLLRFPYNKPLNYDIYGDYFIGHADEYAGDAYTARLIQKAYVDNISAVSPGLSSSNILGYSWKDYEENVMKWHPIPVNTFVNRYTPQFGRITHDGSGGDRWYGIYLFDNSPPLLISTYKGYTLPYIFKTKMNIRRYENDQWCEKTDDLFIKKTMDIKHDIEQRGFVFEMVVKRNRIELLAREKLPEDFLHRDVGYDYRIDPVETILFLWDKDGFYRQ
jgi:hypothetical protein